MRDHLGIHIATVVLLILAAVLLLIDANGHVIFSHDADLYAGLALAIIGLAVYTSTDHP